MTGSAIYTDDMAISASLGSIIVLPKRTTSIAQACMGCGRCADYCPAFLTPTEIKRAFNAGEIDLAEELGALKCIQCGLCSYVCPSRVEITDAVVKAKAAVQKKKATAVKKG